MEKKSWFWSQFSKNLDFGRNCGKTSILYKIFKNLDLGRNLQKNILILVVIRDKSRFGSKLWKKNLHFRQNFRKISILDQIVEKSHFWSEFYQFWSNFQKSQNGRNFWKISILNEIFKRSEFWSKFSKHLNFCQSLRKISILVEIFETFRYCLNFRKISISAKIM